MLRLDPCRARFFATLLHQQTAGKLTVLPAGSNEWLCVRRATSARTKILPRGANQKVMPAWHRPPVVGGRHKYRYWWMADCNRSIIDGCPFGMFGQLMTKVFTAADRSRTLPAPEFLVHRTRSISRLGVASSAFLLEAGKRAAADAKPRSIRDRYEPPLTHVTTACHHGRQSSLGAGGLWR